MTLNMIPMTAAVTSCLTFFSSSSSSSDVAARRVFAHCLFPYLSPGNLLIWAIIRVCPLVYSCFCRYSRWQSFISYFIVRRFCQRGSHNAVIKTGKGQNCSATFSWGYIQLMYNVSYYSNLSVIDTWELTVHFLFCNSLATLKPTKTRCIMLRCNTCGALVFVNGIISQQRIQKLRDFIFTPIRWSNVR